jgi:hypothetical protein
MPGLRAEGMLSLGNQGGPQMHWMDGWDWAWMTFMMSFWVGALGVAVYVAVRLANRPAD